MNFNGKENEMIIFFNKLNFYCNEICFDIIGEKKSKLNNKILKKKEN